MFARIAFVLVLLIPSLVKADTFTFTWDAPTTDSEGNPLAATDITGYKLYSSSIDGVYSTTPKAATTELEVTFDENKVGKYYAVVTAYNEVGESTHSNQVTYEVKRKVPGAPTHLSFLQKIVAFIEGLFKIWA